MNLVEIGLVVFKAREVEIGKILVCVNNTLVLSATFLPARHTTVCRNFDVGSPTILQPALIIGTSISGWRVYYYL